MPRIYLDTNIYSYLKGSADSKYRELNRLLLEYQPVLSIYFSYALIRDKRKDLTDKKFEDFEYIESWTGDNYIAYHPLEKRTSFYLATPIMVFNDNSEDDMNGLLNFFDPVEGEDEMIKAIKAIPKALFQTIPIPIDRDSLNKVPDEQKRILNEIMPHDKEQPTLFDVMENMTVFTRKIFADSSLYKELRTMLYDSINGGKLILNDELDFNEALKNTIVQKSFLEFVEENLKMNHKNGVPFYDFYHSAYNMLDMLGIKKDKITAKNTLNNVHTDGMHSYFAHYCDYFVTDDTNVAIKSKALYKMMGISTMVVSVDEFIVSLQEIYAPGFESLEVFRLKLLDDLQQAERINPDIFGDKTIYRFSRNHRYLTFFDAILEVRGEGISQLIIFKSESNLLSEPGFSEQAQVIQNCLFTFGSDLNDRGEFIYQVRETKEQESAERTWVIENLVIELKHYELIDKYCLVITFPVTTN